MKRKEGTEALNGAGTHVRRALFSRRAPLPAGVTETDVGFGLKLSHSGTYLRERRNAYRWACARAPRGDGMLRLSSRTAQRRGPCGDGQAQHTTARRREAAVLRRAEESK